METLIGKEVWHLDGILRHGHVVLDDRTTPCVTIADENGQTHMAPRILVALTREDAISQCEEEISYWELQKRKLEDGR